MRLVPILTLGLLLLGSAKCQEEEYEPQYYTPAEWAVWIGRIRGFDEIRMTLAVKYIEYPTKWSKEGIKYEERPVFDSLLHEAKEITDTDSLLAILQFQPKWEKSVHGCRGLFNLSFYRRGERVGRLHYAHGRYWHPLTRQSQIKLDQWLTERGFPIAETKKKNPHQG